MVNVASYCVMVTNQLLVGKRNRIAPIVNVKGNLATTVSGSIGTAVPEESIPPLVPMHLAQQQKARAKQRSRSKKT
jgi:hypothetical protein